MITRVAFLLLARSAPMPAPSEVVQHVLTYFLRHPQAADSVEGVTRWRLLESRVDRGIDETDRALDWLVARGFLVKRSAHGSQWIYSLNVERADEAAAFVAASPEKTDGK